MIVIMPPPTMCWSTSSQRFQNRQFGGLTCLFATMATTGRWRRQRPGNGVHLRQPAADRAQSERTTRRRWRFRRGGSGAKRVVHEHIAITRLSCGLTFFLFTHVRYFR
jgi:hypothetical protein